MLYIWEKLIKKLNYFLFSFYLRNQKILIPSIIYLVFPDYFFQLFLIKLQRHIKLNFIIINLQTEIGKSSDIY